MRRARDMDVTSDPSPAKFPRLQSEGSHIPSRLSDASSPIHSPYNFWSRDRSLSPRQLLTGSSFEKERAHFDELVGFQFSDVWQKWKEMEGSMAHKVAQHEITRSKSVRKFSRAISRRGIKFKKRNEDPVFQIIIEKNVGQLLACHESIKKFWESNGKLENYLEGRALALINHRGKIVDLNHHVLPVVGELPDLFDDVVFESWWQSDLFYKKLISQNAYVSSLALSIGAIKALGTPELTMVEFALAIREDGTFSYCMCDRLSTLGLGLSSEQEEMLLRTLNEVNSQTHFQSSFDAYRIPPVTVSPRMFSINRWRADAHHITPIIYRKNTKKYFRLIVSYLNALYDKGTSPMSMGLRALLVGTSKIE
eukprot:TRINITY_DN12922_c0_g1_i1.p1 TRINITY_DN12922_c0_g1~~TRINITY_DN12922_c0_g1_i1.p1  ORF type:complete len:366 (+),score=59.71 TRINITY_DN12922_c0_g1_i1:124-1221(+)